MNVDEVYPSRWLKAEDIGDKKIKVTIESVEKEDFDNGSKLVLFFGEMDKGLVLNLTNKNKMVEGLGKETNDWIGEKIELYTALVSYKKEEVKAIRLKVLSKGEKSPKRGKFE